MSEALNDSLGSASGTSLTGTLTVNGAAVQVTATIGSDGSVSGKLVNADGAPEQVTHFGAGDIFDFSMSRDGKWLALSRGSISSDVVLITRH